MITIRLGAEDREALGAPESMQIDPAHLRLREARLLEEHTGMTVEELAAGLKSAGLKATAALVWMALRRSGCEVSWTEMDFDIAELVVEVGEAPSPASAGN